MTIADEIREVRDTFNSQVTAIRNDDQLSELAVRQRIARAWVDIVAKLADIKTRHQADADAERRRIEHELFRLGDDPTAAISWRDALDRAERALDPKVLDDEPGLAMLNRARVSNDPMLARALLSIAVQQQRRTLVDAFAEAFPDDATLAHDYATAVNPTENRTATFALKMALTPPPKPTEIARLTPDRIRELGDDDA